jgi:uncharacterized damage-inducible protein DinB
MMEDDIRGARSGRPTFDEEVQMAEFGQWLDRMYACNAWVLENVVQASRQLSLEELRQERQGAYGSILATLAHIVGAHQVWLARLDGRSPATMPGEAEMSTLDDVQAACLPVLNEYRARLLVLTPQETARTVSYRTMAGRSQQHSLGEILLHVSLHTSNHLAQVATLLTQVGVEPPPVDYMAWIRAGRP